MANYSSEGALPVAASHSSLKNAPAFIIRLEEKELERNGDRSGWEMGRATERFMNFANARLPLLFTDLVRPSFGVARAGSRIERTRGENATRPRLISVARSQ